MKEQTLTEEATKHAFVLPFLQALGYDVFNPSEIVPEFIADVGISAVVGVLANNIGGDSWRSNILI